MGARRLGDCPRGCTRFRPACVAARRAPTRYNGATAGATAASRRQPRACFSPERGRNVDPGDRAAGRHRLADASRDPWDAPLRRGGLPAAGLERLDHRTNPDRAAGTGGAQGAPPGPLAAGGGRSAAAGEVRSARPRGRVDGYPPGADGAPAASNSHRRARPARRGRLGRRQRRPAGMGAASATDDRHLVPARQGDDAAHLAGARLPARPDRAASTSVLGAGRARAAPAAALARSDRPPAIGGGPTRTRSSSCPGATASVSTGACS